MGNDTSGHDFGHCMIVLNHVVHALIEEKPIQEYLSNEQKFAIKCAAILHEVDDKKLFNTENYDNARKIIKSANENVNIYYLSNKCISCQDIDPFIDLVVSMIDKVSTSSNGICTRGEPWELLVSEADKLEALGKIGIQRAYEYSLYKNRPLFLESTLRITDEEELCRVAESRFKSYNGNSVSMMDHFYDKIVYLANNLSSENSYIAKEIKARRKIIIDYCLYFGKNGTLMDMDF